MGLIDQRCRAGLHTKVGLIKQCAEPESTNALNMKFRTGGVDKLVTKDVERKSRSIDLYLYICATQVNATLGKCRGCRALTIFSAWK
jgi:hypothetical protein